MVAKFPIFYWRCLSCGWESLDQPLYNKCPNCGKKRVVRVTIWGVDVSLSDMSGAVHREGPGGVVSGRMSLPDIFPGGIVNLNVRGGYPPVKSKIGGPIGGAFTVVGVHTNR